MQPMPPTRWRLLTKPMRRSPTEASADEETDAADAADEVAVADEADAEVADEASADEATDTDNKEEE